VQRRAVRCSLVVAVVVAALAAVAASDPAARHRVVLADPDPELRHAVDQALAPWQLEVVLAAAPPTGTADARRQADAEAARFVVWRDGDALVVYDRELGATERRAVRARTLDPPAAAAAALTIKTMMRLPALAAPAAPTSSPVSDPVVQLRLQAGVASRIPRGEPTRASVRFGGAVTWRPWASAAWRFGIVGDAGTATSVARASFQGTWSEWGVLAIAGWTYARGGWELEPHVGTGLRRSSLDGTEMASPRREAATLATARAGGWLRWRIARWTVGVAVELDTTLRAPTYTKAGTPAVIFRVPDVTIDLGAMIAVDL
jgi:hypothetical protein